MPTTWLHLGPLAVRSPVTAITNLLLALQCAVYFLALRRALPERSRLWAVFFLLMSIATLAGAFKHGARHLLDESALTLVLALSNLAAGAAAWFAQRAAITSYAATRCKTGYDALAGTQIAAFAIANVLLGPAIQLLILNTLLGLLPVIVAERRARWRAPGAGLVASGLSLSVATGAVYLLRISPIPWLNHIDIAHLLMGVSFLVVHRGVTREGGRSWR